MRWFVGSDHAGLPLKRPLAEVLRRLGDDVVDVGTFDDTSVDYPSYGAEVGPMWRAFGAELKPHSVEAVSDQRAIEVSDPDGRDWSDEHADFRGAGNEHVQHGDVWRNQ